MKQGQIFLTDFCPSRGHKYKKERPAVIVSGNKILKEGGLITVMPITSNMKLNIHDIEIKKDNFNNLHKNSVIKAKDIYSFDRRRFKAFIGSVDENIIEKIKEYIQIHFDLN